LFIDLSTVNCKDENTCGNKYLTMKAAKTLLDDKQNPGDIQEVDVLRSKLACTADSCISGGEKQHIKINRYLKCTMF
jgi:hypothetical protein